MLLGQPVLVDTNVIIEAVRLNGWGALKAYFSVETVNKCCEEARSGRAHRPGYVSIDEPALREKLQSHPVSLPTLASFAAKCESAMQLDDGERHLWAHAMERTDAWIASSGDKAAVFAACALGWRDRLVSLEELLEAAGARHAARKIGPQFTKSRLDQWCGEYLLR